MLLKFILFLLLTQLTWSSSIRSNIWWSRRHDDSQFNCDIELNYENPTLEAKICGYCFAKCQQNLASCLFKHLNEISNDSIDHCHEKAIQCERRCFADKRTSRIAQENWTKVVQVLQKYKSDGSNSFEKMK